jgi:hypothetical protein
VLGVAAAGAGLAAVRREILAEVSARPGGLLHGCHFPFPGLGRVRPLAEGGYAVDPVGTR